MLDRTRFPTVFDCHIHVPSLDGQIVSTWAPSIRACGEVVAYLDLLRIDGAVLMSSRAGWATTVQEQAAGNQELVSVLKMHPGRFTAGISVNGNWPDESIEQMRFYRGEHGYVWLGECLGYIGKFAYDLPGWWRILDEAARLDMVIHIHCRIDEMSEFARRYPEATFVYPHFPGQADLAPLMEMLRTRPNVYMDICGSQYVRMGVLEMAVRTAGADRVLFGSDLTVCDPAPAMARVLYADIDDAAKRLIYSENVLRMLRQRGVEFPFGSA